MSPFVLELSDHAKLRLKQRAITRNQVRLCLTHGTQKSFDIRGRRVRIIKIRSRILEVIYLEISGGYLIVTAYWMNS